MKTPKKYLETKCDVPSVPWKQFYTQNEVEKIMKSYAEQHAKAVFRAGALEAYKAERLGADLDIDIAFEYWYKDWLSKN